MNTYDWYQQLIKPAWAPPAWLFGPVWTVLYIIIAVSFGYAAYLSFTPIQFGLSNNFLAALDIIFVLAALVLALSVIYKRVKWVALINIPYLLWVCFATALQLTITVINWK